MADESVLQKNAMQLLADVFASYGLSDEAFVSAIKQAVLDNTDKDGNVATASATYQIRQTPAYQARFAGNLMRKEAIAKLMAEGKTPSFGELSEAKYIELEDSYKATLQKYNVPSQFYDNTASLARLIGSDLSPNELDTRASLAQQAASQANPEIKAQLKALYNVDENQIAAFFLDPTLAREAIDVTAAGKVAIVAAASQRSGMTMTRDEAQKIIERVAPTAETGIDAQALFGETARTAGLTQGSISGGQASVSATDVILSATGDKEAQAKLEREAKARGAEYQATSGMQTSTEGVTSLRRANI